MGFLRLFDKLPGRRGQGAPAQPPPAPVSAGQPAFHPPEEESWLALAALADGYLARMEPRAKETPDLFAQAQSHAQTLADLAISLDEALDDKTSLRFFETLGELGVVCSRAMMNEELKIKN